MKTLILASISFVLFIFTLNSCKDDSTNPVNPLSINDSIPILLYPSNDTSITNGDIIHFSWLVPKVWRNNSNVIDTFVFEFSTKYPTLPCDSMGVGGIFPTYNHQDSIFYFDRTITALHLDTIPPIQVFWAVRISHKLTPFIESCSTPLSEIRHFYLQP